ncbi:MAG: hypothetical protein H7837_06200 [Magnetococcus sp. MYC-9]
MNTVSGRRWFACRVPARVAALLMTVMVATPIQAKADHALAAVFGGAVLLTSLIHAASHQPPQVVYHTAPPVVYYPRQVVYQTVAPVAYYHPRPVVYRVVPRY